MLKVFWARHQTVSCWRRRCSQAGWFSSVCLYCCASNDCVYQSAIFLCLSWDALQPQWTSVEWNGPAIAVLQPPNHGWMVALYLLYFFQDYAPKFQINNLWECRRNCMRITQNYISTMVHFVLSFPSMGKLPAIICQPYILALTPAVGSHNILSPNKTQLGQDRNPHFQASGYTYSAYKKYFVFYIRH